VPFFLRKIRRAKWYREDVSDMTWLPKGEIQADALGDLSTKENTLSVYRIDDSSNLDRVVAALATTGTNLSNVDYALIDTTSIEPAKITVVATKGETADDTVNSWHYDLIELSVQKIIALALTISIHSENLTARKNKKAVEQLIIDNILKRHIKKSLINKDEMLQELNRLLTKSGANWPED
jgi:hypothetical protein